MPREIITTIIEPVAEDIAEVMPESTLNLATPAIDDLISTLEEGINAEDTTPETGFAITFTSDKVYDLDAIIASISRDNDDEALVMHVNLESEIVLAIIDMCVEALKVEYTAANLEDILDYQNVFNTYFEEHFDEYSELARAAGIEGELLLDEKQAKLAIDRVNLKKYLFDEIKSTDVLKPILNYTKAMTQWTEIGDGDGTIAADFDTIELYQARIDALEERIIELT